MIESLPASLLTALRANALYSAVLLAFVIPATIALRRRSPQFREALWSLMLIRLVLPPSLSLPFSLGNISSRWVQATAANYGFGLALQVDAAPVRRSATLCVIWLAGAIVTFAWLQRRRHALRRLASHGREVVAPLPLEISRRWMARYGIRRQVRLVSLPR